MYNEKRVRNSELLQLILLDNLYAQSRSERIIFQGGTALRWVYGGTRFSEDLDFVTDLPRKYIEKVLHETFQTAQRACVAQFGHGQSEYVPKGKRKEAAKFFFVYRPQTQRERIAVRLEFEFLRTGRQPQFRKYVLRDLPLVSGLITEGKLIIPYSSSIILVETPEEILSDKVRAVYERDYLKGRDIFDIWWLRKHLNLIPDWTKVRRKLEIYQAPFVPARQADYFQTSGSNSSILEALRADLPRFLPQSILSVYQEEDFSNLITVLGEVTSDLLGQGMAEYFKNYGKGKIKP